MFVNMVFFSVGGLEEILTWRRFETKLEVNNRAPSWTGYSRSTSLTFDNILYKPISVYICAMKRKYDTFEDGEEQQQ